MDPSVAERPLAEVIAAGGVRAAFQPIVDLATGSPVGFEALARGPEGSGLEMPAGLFPAAARAGLAPDLEGACLRAAFDGAWAAGLTGGAALFVNLEPGLLDDEGMCRLSGLRQMADDDMPIFIELTERELIRNPMELFRSVDRMREMGFRIALDDVGADAASLALLPFLDPEVIKLDLSLIHDHARGEVAQIVHAVNAEAERTGAVILAEGIEHEAHLERAWALGATLGQGWLFGRPGPIPARLGVSRPIVLHINNGQDFAPTPFEIVSASRETRVGDKRLLLALSIELEAHAELHGGSTVLMSTFQRSEFFTEPVARRYAPLVDRLPLVGALAEGANPRPSAGVRWRDLPKGDPLIGEWDVAVVAPHFTAAFVARDLGDSGPDMDRRFEFAVTHERGLAVRAARSMMRRLAASGAGERGV